MPIITSGATTTPPQVTFPDAAYASVTYIDPSGAEWPMTDTSASQWALAENVAGLGAAPYVLTSDPHPRGGARLRHAQPQARTITWPVLVQGSTHAEFISRWRALAKAFTRTLRDGPGTLEFQRPDGSRRQIEVRYDGGYDVIGQAASGITWDIAVVSLWCEDPYWVDPSPHVVHREYAVGEDFLTPYPSVSSGQVLGATTVTNPGDVIVWPEWTITGPASLVTFTHEGTGEEFIFDPTPVHGGALQTGETVTIRTDPVQVRYQDGTNFIGGLNWPGATLWGLDPGANPVSFQLDGSAAGSAVDMTFFPRYETV